MGSELARIENVQQQIMVIRGHRVILDSALAGLYSVETKALKRAVNRNRTRFPPDFMFQLSREEARILRCQIGTLRWGQHAKYRSYVFTEQGVAMLSSVLRSERAVHVNIAIMRAFIQLRQALAGPRELAEKLAELEKRVASGEEGIRTLFQAIRQLMAPPELPRKKIGFHVRERAASYGRRR